MSCSKMWVQMTRFENAKYFHFTESDITYLRLIAFSFVALSFLFYSFFLHLLHFFLSHCTHSLSLAYRFYFLSIETLSYYGNKQNHSMRNDFETKSNDFQWKMAISYCRDIFLILAVSLLSYCGDRRLQC